MIILGIPKAKKARSVYDDDHRQMRLIATSNFVAFVMSARLSDLPQDIPADPIYAQIKALTQKIADLKSVKERMQSEKRQMTFTAIDRQGLIFKIRRTIQNLEITPVELRRSVYSNVGLRFFGSLIA